MPYFVIFLQFEKCMFGIWNLNGNHCREMTAWKSLHETHQNTWSVRFCCFNVSGVLAEFYHQHSSLPGSSLAWKYQYFDFNAYHMFVGHAILDKEVTKLTRSNFFWHSWHGYLTSPLGNIFFYFLHRYSTSPLGNLDPGAMAEPETPRLVLHNVRLACNKWDIRTYLEGIGLQPQEIQCMRKDQHMVPRHQTVFVDLATDTWLN